MHARKLLPLLTRPHYMHSRPYRPRKPRTRPGQAVTSRIYLKTFSGHNQGIYRHAICSRHDFLSSVPDLQLMTSRRLTRRGQTNPCKPQKIELSSGSMNERLQRHDMSLLYNSACYSLYMLSSWSAFSSYGVSRKFEARTAVMSRC